MKIYRNVEQRSPEWFELKYRKVGGTRSKGLVENPETLLIELISEFGEDYVEQEEGFISDSMLDGIVKEPEARAALNAYTGHEFEEVGWVQSDIDLLGISPDGITADGKRMCEIKCPQAKKHVDTCLKDEIPPDNIDQCIHYFTVNKELKELYFLSYRPEFYPKPMFIKILTPESLVDIGLKKEIEIEVIGKMGLPIKPKIKKVPDLKTIAEVVAMKRKAARFIETEIPLIINQLKF